jgi:hypothetical protein
VAERDDRAWAAAAAPELVEQARREALAEVGARLRARMVDALLDAVDDPRPAPPPRAAPAPPAAPAPAGTGVWVYGVLGEDAAEPEGWAGVDARGPVRTVRRAGLCALVSDVPLPEFGPSALQDRLEDLGRLEELARAHEQVLDRALVLGPLVPFRLCTIYETDASLGEMLTRERGSLAEALERLAGAREWGVKGWLVEGGERDDAGVGAAARSGTEYLTRKRDVREAAEQARERTWQLVEGVHARLSEQAAAAVVGRLHDRRLSGRDEEMVLNASYLVPDERLDAFRAVVGDLGERHRADGLELELTGPWPAYHFVDAEPA